MQISIYAAPKCELFAN